MDFVCFLLSEPNKTKYACKWLAENFLDMGLTPITSTKKYLCHPPPSANEWRTADEIKKMRISRHRHFSRPITPTVHIRANEFIRVPELRVIDEAGENLGVLSTSEARRLAEERGYDLVEVNPIANPPVAKFLNYGQYKYEKEKELKKQKQALKEIDIKGIRLTPRIGTHDLELRQDQATDFLQDGNKVKIEVVMRGRERQHMDLAFKLVNNFIEILKSRTALKVETLPKNEGGRLQALLAPEKK